MNLMRLCFIVPQTIDGVVRRKAVFEAVEIDSNGNPKRRKGGGFEPLNNLEGKPLRASLLLGNWEDGTGLLHATVKRGGKVTEVSNFVLSRPGEFMETRLLDGSIGQVAKTVTGYHPYVTCELDRRVKDGMPVMGADGHQVINVVEPSWVLYASATGTFSITATQNKAPAAIVADDPA